MALSEEVAWVRGSSTGIGRAVAVELAAGGRRVVIHYNASEDEAREVVKEIEGSGGEAQPGSSRSSLPPRPTTWWGRSSRSTAASL